MPRHSALAPDPDVEAARAELVAGGTLAPLRLGSLEEQLWSDCDLASLAENRLGEVADPRTLDEGGRADWRARALAEKPCPPSAREHEGCYWLLDHRERAGTIAIGNSSPGGRSVQVASLYLFPSHRRRGTARAALEGLREVLGRRNLGVRLETEWTWQHAVRFYLGIGMWVRSWKRDLAFWSTADTPAPRIRAGRDYATLSIRLPRSAEETVLIAARRSGGRLHLDDAALPTPFDHLRFDAMSTLSVGLALGNWPLVRSPEWWERCRASDLGAPEALAYKITIWEAWSRKHGWRVETPVIPGLDYPAWDELDAQWTGGEA